MTLPPAEARDLLALSSAAFDRLLLSIGDEYAGEAAKCSRNSRQHSKLDRVERLLAGETLTSDQLDYPLYGWHVALVVEGAEALKALWENRPRDRPTLLSIEPRSDTVWGMVGGQGRG